MLNSDSCYKYLLDLEGLALKQQIGVDLTLERVKEIVGNHNKYFGVYKGDAILKEKTHIPDPNITYQEFFPKNRKIEKIYKENKGEIIKTQEEEINCWHLYPGVYSLTFNQGCKLPNNISAEIKGRSSLNRLGCRIESGIYDPGFEVENMGAVLYVSIPIIIEYRARVAQIIMHECEPTSNSYNGQFQKDKDIK